MIKFVFSAKLILKIAGFRLLRDVEHLYLKTIKTAVFYMLLIFKTS